MEGDPQFPTDYEFVDWGVQPDGHILTPSFQTSQAVENKRYFGLQREAPCGCYSLSVRSSLPLKVDTTTREILEYGHAWKIEKIKCKEHK